MEGCRVVDESMSRSVIACKVCGGNSRCAFSHHVMAGKYEAKYLQCTACGFLFVDDPHWLTEAYADPINLTDTGYVLRNIRQSRQAAILLAAWGQRRSNFIDYAGGYGMFVRLMRDKGFRFHWWDPYAQNIFAKGMEADFNGHYDAATVMECFEHFVDPQKELLNILKLSRTVIFTTELLPEPLPGPYDWMYYGFEHGQHVSFFTRRSLKALAESNDLRFWTFRGMHVLSDKKWVGLPLILAGLNSCLVERLLLIGQRPLTWDDHRALQPDP